MHFIALLHDRMPGLNSTVPNIKLRGFDPKTWVAPELQEIKLPVNAIAHVFCPTYRDIYLEMVEGKVMPPTWERYQGRVIDEVYKSIHKECEQYVSQCKAHNCDIYGYLISQQDGLIDKAKKKFQKDSDDIATKPNEDEIRKFDESLKKIVRFEAEITSSHMDFEISRLKDASPKKIFDDFFHFITDYAITAKHQGFGTPSIPDFIFRNTIIGDIKSGPWQDFLINTVIAYALAYEEYTGKPMDFGSILHVDLIDSRLVPTHYGATIEQLNDYLRERFILVRDRKLQIIKDKIDPGKPDDQKKCAGCSFRDVCWGNTK